MLPLPMVVRHEVVKGAAQAALSEQDEAVETLLPAGTLEAICGLHSAMKGTVQSSSH